MSEEEEAMPEFNKKHYPKGVNADFYNVDGKPNEEMLKLFKGRLEDPENRDIAREKGKLIGLLKKTCGLSSGNVVVDLGSGSGILIEDVLSIIRDDERKGRLIATEISEFFVDHLEAMRKEKGWEDVLDIVYSPDPKDPKLDTYNGTVDFVFVIDVYHHIEYPQTVMKKLLNVLKEDGKLVVLDFIRDPSVHKSHPPEWILEHVRAGQEVFRQEIIDSGFSLVCEPPVPFLRENYIMIFEPSKGKKA